MQNQIEGNQLKQYTYHVFENIIKHLTSQKINIDSLCIKYAKTLPGSLNQQEFVLLAKDFDKEFLQQSLYPKVLYQKLCQASHSTLLTFDQFKKSLRQFGEQIYYQKDQQKVERPTTPKQNQIADQGLKQNEDSQNKKHRIFEDIKKPIQQLQQQQQQQNQQQPIQVGQINQKILTSIRCENPEFDFEPDFQLFAEPNMTQINNYQYFKDLFNNLKLQKQIYTDQEFPHNNTTLGQRFVTLNYDWKRLSKSSPNIQVFSKQTQLTGRYGYGKYIDPTDIIQGELGDCYFLSVLATIAYRRPELIYHTFITQVKNEYSIYGVIFYIDGIPTCIYIDDYLPFLYNQLAFSKAKSDMWVSLLEKAWAKVFGCFSKVESGICLDSFEALTGAPSITLFTEDKEFWADLLRYGKERNYILSCSSQSVKDSTKTLINANLIPSHAYSLLRIFQIKHQQLGDLILLKVRNPWGKQEIQTKWVVNSQLWTNDLQYIQKSIQKNKGTFIVDQDEFVRYFNNVTVCMVKDGYIHSHQKVIANRKKGYYYTFKVEYEGGFFISLHQVSKRMMGNDYEYGEFKLLIGMMKGNQYEFIGAKTKQDKSIFVECNLKAGEYILYCKSRWQKVQEDKFTIQIYGNQQINLNLVKKISDFKCLVYQQKFKQEIMNQQMNLDCYQMDKRVGKCYKFNLDEGFGGLYISNKSDKKLKSEMILTMQGLKLIKPMSGNVIKAYVKGQSEVFYLFDVSCKGFNFQMREQYLID